jgi:hypothetical protein
VNIAEVNDTATKIVAYLAKEGKASRSDLNTRCLKGHTSKTRLDAALDELLSSNPPQITVESVPRPKGSPGNATKIYQITGAKSAKSAKSEHQCGFQCDSEKSEVCDVSEGSFPDERGFAALRTLRKGQNGALTRLDVDSSHTSHVNSEIEAPTYGVAPTENEVF